MATAKTEDVFETLRLVDVTDHVEEKDTGRAKLKYLSWAWAWHEVRRRCPDATYTIVKNDQGLPYFVDPQTGIMVYTTVTINGETHEMWLPVMDGANNPMRLEAYDLQMSYGKKHVNAATMFDINKTVMRCLTKNLAMFGIGLALYAGEDLFDDTEGSKGEPKSEPKPKKSESKTAEENSEDETVNLKDIQTAVHNRVKALANKMTVKEKDALANTIEAEIGTKNYLKCEDAEKLKTLLSKLNAA